MGSSSPALHPAVQGLSSSTLASSPLSGDFGIDPTSTQKSFYDGDGIIVSNSNSLDNNDDVGSGGVESGRSGEGVRPSKSKQKNDIDKLLVQHGTDLVGELGGASAWFLLEKSWWESWRRFVESDSPTPSARKSSYAEAAIASAGPPPPIDNWSLTAYDEASASDEEKAMQQTLRQNYRYALCSLTLRPGLQSDADFVALPRDAWEALRTWYGGGPPIPRFSAVQQQENAEAKGEGEGVGESKEGSSSPSSLKLPQLDLYPSAPPSVADVLGGLGSARSPGGSFTRSDHGGEAEHGGAKALLEDDDKREFMFNDCGRSLRGLRSGVKMGDSCFVCRKGAWFNCPRCRAVHYCGKECQAAHWPFHKVWCSAAVDLSHLPAQQFEKKVKVGFRGRVGLFNLGNSCYLNSSLQCLSHIKPLTTYFLTGRHQAEINKTNYLGTGGALAEEYAKLMQQMWFCHETTFQPLAFKKLLGRLQPDWAGFGQHDANEVMGFLLDKLHEDLNRVEKKPYVEKREGDGVNDVRIAAEQWEANTTRDDSIVRDLVGSLYRSRITCPECGKVSVSFDAQNSLLIQIPRSTQRNFRVILIPWRGSINSVGAGGEALHPIATEFAVEVDRLSTIYSIKRWILRRLRELHPKLFATASQAPSLTLCVYNIPLGQVIKIINAEQDDDCVSIIPDNITLVAYLLPTDAQDSDSCPLFLQQRVFYRTRDPSKGGTVLSLPVMFPVTQSMTCWKVRTLVWRHLKALVRKDSPLGLLLAGASRQDCAMLEIALASLLPLRVVRLDNAGNVLPVVVTSGINSAAHVAEAAAPSNDPMGPRIAEQARKLAALGLTIDGGLGFGVDRALGSIVPIDKQTMLTSLIRNNCLCMDWSHDWLEQLDIAAIQGGASRDDSAVQAYGGAASAGAARRRSMSGGEGTIRLEQCLRDYTKEETLDDEESFYCSECKAHPPGTKKAVSLLAAHLPEILIIMLKRFNVRSVEGRSRFGGSMSFQEKIDTFVDFPLDGLDLAPFCDDPTSSSRTVYDLFAVCNHYGRMGFGHYSAFARDWLVNGQLADTWVSFDDNDVRLCEDPNDVKTPAAYILFYRRRP
jgi:ubiquitin carboxyl-terminal hydrolase 4/11/15